MNLFNFYSRATLEFLPVYQPNADEIADPELYANNVRKIMAEALEIPTFDMSFEQVKQTYSKRKTKDE